MVENLTLGGLSGPLKAMKRERLAAELEKVAEISSRTDFHIGNKEEE